MSEPLKVSSPPPLAYSKLPPRVRRPKLATAVAILSILIGAVSGLFDLGMGGSAFLAWRLPGMLLFVPPIATAAPGPTTVSTGLTQERAEVIIKGVQEHLGGQTPLTATQMEAIRREVKSPGQALVSPDASGNSVWGATLSSNGVLWIVFERNQRGTVGDELQVGRNGRTYLGFSPPPPSGAMTCIMVGLAFLLGIDATLLFVAGILMFRRATRSRAMHLLYARTMIPLAVLASIAAMCLEYDLIGPKSLGVVTFSFVGWTLVWSVPGAAYPYALLRVFRSTTMRDYFAAS